VSRAGGHAVRHRVMSTVVERSSPTTARGVAPAVASTCTYVVGVGGLHTSGGQRRHLCGLCRCGIGNWMGSGNDERRTDLAKIATCAALQRARSAL
jgi:hypothetical protein